MPEWVLQILLVSIIIPMLTYIGVMLRKIMNAKIDEWLAASSIKQKEEIRAALTDAQDKLSSAVYDAVMETQATFVAGLKKSGNFTSIAACEAMRKSSERTKQIMSNAAMDIIQKQTGNLDTMIQTKIEALLPEIKSAVEVDRKSRSIRFYIPACTVPVEEDDKS